MRKILLVTVAAVALTGFAGSASAATCIGNCGSAAPNGDVTAPPEYGPNYSYVSTNGGQTGAGQIAGIGGTNGSEFVTDSFNAAAGDALNFYFNYITSDGAGFSDYAFAQLLTAELVPIAFLFTARTQPSGDTSPGFGLPANASTLTPLTSAIIGGAPDWAQLGADSGECYDVGCGYTGWIGSSYIIQNDGSFVLRLGVTNFSDAQFESGLAFAGITIDGIEIPTPGTGAVPEPSTWAMMLLGFGMIGLSLRHRRRMEGSFA